ncbi:HlyD family efflux transporter periplasmic adaptor subunit [uncultured Pedobacter sp.]|uniref:HlyD family efflux transporter periplasmic adaptor subunit n=1 Tax=uncultured Pedobacter sp. TaxID=246139 RepID=UPI0025F5C350|nr:HlyD family efflux transporter periplasmic adaptor subunit [uncultured Pedobacter sp.]
MPQEINLDEVHSEEVQDIIGRLPKWAVRRGNMIIAAIVCLIVVAAWLIKYPDIISAPVYISSSLPPVKVVSNTSGRLTAFDIKDGAIINKDEVLGIIDNPALADDMFYLKKQTEQWDGNALNNKGSLGDFIKRDLQVGEVQAAYSDLYLHVSDYLEHPQKGKTQLHGQIKRIRGLIANWENRFVLRSPIAGKVVLFDVWNENQYVPANSIVAMIVPQSKDYVLRVPISVKKAGKLKKGQEAMISLQDYPYQEFGMLRAVINQITVVPLDTTYLLQLQLKNGLHTTKGYRVEPKLQMLGNAEIIVENKSVLQRIIKRI